MRSVRSDLDPPLPPIAGSRPIQNLGGDLTNGPTNFFDGEIQVLSRRPKAREAPVEVGQFRPLSHSLLVQRPDASMGQPGLRALEDDLGQRPRTTDRVDRCSPISGVVEFLLARPSQKGGALFRSASG